MTDKLQSIFARFIRTAELNDKQEQLFRELMDEVDKAAALDQVQQAGAEVDRALNGWISVEDRLPEREGSHDLSVTVYVTDGFYVCRGYYSFYDGEWYPDYFNQPLYWQLKQDLPLPPPPASDEGEGKNREV